MAHHISTCTSPIVTRNKFTGDMISVPCGHCDGCLNTRAFRWSKRLEQEMLCHPYVFFITLTYDDAHLPSYRYVDGELVSNRQNDDTGRCQPIQLETLYNRLGSQGKDLNYVVNRLDHPLGLPHGSVEDLQKFFKRLNRYLNYHVTQSYKNFLYFFVCEYGPTTLRPHYHGILYFESKGFADKAGEILSKTWTFGNSFAEPVKYETASSNYVAQYLNCFARLPKVYTQFSEIRPFFLCSRKTIIGSNVPLDSDLREIFIKASPRRSVPSFRSHRFLDVPLLPSIENRLFPKLPRYYCISDTDRITLYGLYELSNCTNFKEFQKWCKYQVERIFPQGWQKNIIYHFIMCITYGGDFRSQRSINALYRLYCLTRRVSFNAASFGLSVRDYACHILRYWERKYSYNLKTFYQFQSEYVIQHPLPDLIHCYPEFYHQYVNGGDVPYLGYVLDSFNCDFFPFFHDTFDIRAQVFIQRKIREENTKTHRKNEYLESKKMRDLHLKQILKDYYE